ncbi:MAG: DNA polymerase domain-containing protein [Candidatus Aenigmatarchaeota archaeon]
MKTSFTVFSRPLKYNKVIKMLVQLLDLDYFLNGNKPVIRMFCKTDNGKAVCLLYDKFQPYFYVRKTDDNMKTIEENGLTHAVEKKFLPMGYSEAPASMVKIILNDPQSVPKVRELFKESYDSDVIFKYRFMVDNEIKGMCWYEIEGSLINTNTSKLPTYDVKTITPVEKNGNVDLKYLCFDIECLQTDFNRQMDAKKDPIIMISLAFFPKYRNYERLVLVSKAFSSANAQGHPDEKDMLVHFMKILEEYDPDVMTGFNIMNFDFPHILERLKKYNIAPMLGRCDKPVFTRPMKIVGKGDARLQIQDITIPGRIVFDSYQVIRKDVYIRLPRYNLATVAEALIGEKKGDVVYHEIPKLWISDVQKLVDYADNDAKISLNLVLKRRLLDNFIEVSKLSGVLLQDSFGGQTVRIETLIMHEFKKRNMIMPTKPNKTVLEKRESEKIKGATVLEPRKGLNQECVLVLDFQSLYPSIIIAYNVSPDSLVSGETNLKHNTSPTGARFVSRELYQGIFPTIIKKLIDSRRAVKKEMMVAEGQEKIILDAKQHAIKILANSVVGDTHIIVKDPGDNVRVCEIGELYNELKAGANIKKVGNTNVIEVDGWKSLSVDGTKSVFKPMYAISQHKHNRPLVKVKTSMAEVTMTEDHSAMEIVGKSANRNRESKFESIVPVKGKDVNKDTVICQISKLTLPEKDMTLNIIKELSDLDDIDNVNVFIPKNLLLGRNKKILQVLQHAKKLDYTDSVTLQKTAGVGRRVVIRAEQFGLQKTGMTTKGNCGCVPVYKLNDTGDEFIEFNSVISKKKDQAYYYSIPLKEISKVTIPHAILKKCYISVYGRRKIPVLLPVDEKLGELLGWYVAKGSMYSKKYITNKSRDGQWYKVDISNKDQKNLKNISSLVESVFNYKPSVHKTGGACAVTIPLKVCYLLFKKLCGKGSENKHVPYFVFNSLSSVKDAFLKGYMDGDGRRASTKSRKLAAGLNVLFKSKGLLTRNVFDGVHRICIGKHMRGKRIVNGDLYGQTPKKIESVFHDDYVYDLSVKNTENFVTAQGMVLHNSFYGYCGYIRARLYVNEVASSITAYGRENIQKTKEHIESNFPVKVIYGDSITKDRFVTIMENGFVKIRNIEELFNVYAKRQRNDGKEIVVPDNLKAFTIDPKTQKPIWARIKRIIRHGANKNIFRINQKFGETVVTEDHSIMTFNNGRLFETKPQEMAGKNMIRVDNVPKVKIIKSVDLSGKKINTNTKEFNSLCGAIGCYLSGSNRNPVVFNSIKTYASVLKEMCGQKHNKHLPDFIYHLPNNHKRLILRNMGCIENNFRYETKSLHLASGLSFLLNQLCIKYTIRHRPEKGTYILTTCSKYNNITKTKITKERYNGVVYDLEVDDSCMFVDSCGQILLHNTDSLFLATTIKDVEEGRLLGEKISKAASQGDLIFEFEKVYKTSLILAKKRYAGWKFQLTDKGWKDSIDMKGIETVRRDWCPLVTETMNTVINIMLKEGDVKKATDFVKSVLQDIMRNRVSVEKLTIIKGITKSIDAYDGMLPHIELARKLKKRDPMNPPKVGDRLEYVVIKGREILSKRVETPAYVKEYNLPIDSEYYINNQLLPPIERIMSSLGVERTELFGGGRQYNLMDTITKNSALLCNSCGKVHRRIPLSMSCECGAKIQN